MQYWSAWASLEWLCELLSYFNIPSPNFPLSLQVYVLQTFFTKTGRRYKV